MDKIADKNLVDSKEFGLMKARTCLNCGKFKVNNIKDCLFTNMSYYFKFELSVCNGWKKRLCYM